MEIPNYDSDDNQDKKFKQLYTFICHQIHFEC